jgi:hypothetical protein
MMATEQRLNDVANVILALVAVKQEGEEASARLTEVIEKLDREGTLVLVKFASMILGLADDGEEAGDGDD